jgi:hypothetical protein
MVKKMNEDEKQKVDTKAALRTFECVNCDHIHKEHLAADPMASSEVLG